MSGDHKSLDGKLKSEDWTVERLIHNSDLPSGLCELAIDIAKGKYDAVMIVPSRVARQGESWMIKGDPHIVYVRRNADYSTNLELSRTVIMAHCEHIDSGEGSYLRIT